MPQHTPLLVELAGSNGVGKSTIAPLLAAQMREMLGPDLVAALPEKDVPRSRRHWTRIQRRIWLATHPSILWNAWKSPSPRDWLFIHSSMGLARRALWQGCRIAIADQGLLRAARSAQDVAAFPQAHLPDLVLHLVCDTATTTLRQLLRKKKIHTRFQGEDRIVQAQAQRAKLEGLPRELIHQAMHAFAKNFCEPSLDTETIEILCSSEFKKSEAIAGAPGRCAPEVMDSLACRGTAIETIDNSYPLRPEDCVKACLQSILPRLDITHTTP